MSKLDEWLKTSGSAAEWCETVTELENRFKQALEMVRVMREALDKINEHYDFDRAHFCCYIIDDALTKVEEIAGGE